MLDVGMKTLAIFKCGEGFSIALEVSASNGNYTFLQVLGQRRQVPILFAFWGPDGE